MRQTSLIPKPPPPPSSSTQLMSLIPCSLLFICNFLHCTLSYTHTKSESIFSVLWGLKVELCWPLVSPQLQALQGPSGGHGCLATSLCLHLSCEGPPLNPHLPFIILIIAPPFVFISSSLSLSRCANTGRVAKKMCYYFTGCCAEIGEFTAGSCLVMIARGA